MKQNKKHVPVTSTVVFSLGSVPTPPSSLQTNWAFCLQGGQQAPLPAPGVKHN